MIRSALVMVVISLGLAHADGTATSLEHYKKGRAAYGAGNFDAAIAEFERAYQAMPAPEYLHDIAQAYRRLGRCDALGYFERYLADKPAAKNRVDVESAIDSMRERCASPVSMAAASTTPVASPPPPSEILSVQRTAPSIGARSPYSLAGSTSLLFLEMGPVIIPAVGQFDVAVRRRAYASPVTIDAGASLSFAGVPYDDDGATGTMWLVAPQLHAEVGYPLFDRLSLVGTARLGALVITGLGEGNPYTQGAMPASAFATLSTRVDLGVAWQATQRLRAHVTPIGVHWSPRRGPLADDISSIRAFAMSAGVVVSL